MPLIQFRIHPSVGMARFGDSQHWYFVGPEFPVFLQEQFPNLRHRPVPRRHPARLFEQPAMPDEGRFRDTDGRVMPQAARFRVFAYFYNTGSNEPYKVIEVTTSEATISWTVKVANRKTVRRTNNVDAVLVNDPPAATLTTVPPSSPTRCQSGTLPNLAWVMLEDPTGRLHVIGNEGLDRNEKTSLTPDAPSMFQYDWFDPAADGPVIARVKPNPSFLSQFPGLKYLIPGLHDPQPLPLDGTVDAVPAWVVVNLPDYVPDFGHFVSLWDVALDLSLHHAENGRATTVFGRHLLVTSKAEVNHYRFYDYQTHVHPPLTVFTDVTRTSGQARNASGRQDNRFVGGILIDGLLQATAKATDTTIAVETRAALRLRAASGITPSDPATHFVVVLAQNVVPFETAHELVRCTAIADDGTLAVDRAVSGTAAEWPQTPATAWIAAPKGTAVEAKSVALLSPSGTVLKVEPVAAHKMRQPSVAPGDQGDAPFLIAITAGSDVEWLRCTRNEKKTGELSVTRAQLGTTAKEWPAGSDVIAAGGGHKNFDARAHMKALASGPRGPAHRRIFERLRLPVTLYGRTFPAAAPKDPAEPRRFATGFPREFGRRFDMSRGGAIDALVPDSIKWLPDSMNADAQGSLARHWTALGSHKSHACSGTDLGTGSNEIELLDDMYWIVTERDMPMLKDYALTRLQYDQFHYWAEGRAGGARIRSAPLFTPLFSGTKIAAFFKAAHTPDEYFAELQRLLPRYAPAFLDMAHMGKMLGGSFMPGMEVGREGGIAENWSLLHGGTRYFPDLRFYPASRMTPHLPGMLTKDLAVPWFNDYISCNETYWPTSRPQIVYEEHGFAYQWLLVSRIGIPNLPHYWKKVGFIRRTSSGALIEEERSLPRVQLFPL